MRRIVIVGAGAAGWSAALELRRRGYSGALTMLGDESPYDRPACSKGILSGHQRPKDIVLALPTGMLEFRAGSRAVELDLRRRLVGTAEGAFEFDGLILATGTMPSVRPDWPIHEPGIHTLHSLDDAWAVRRRLRWTRKLIVIGGGLTGCEAACVAADLGIEVVIVDAAPTLMRRAVGPEIGDLVTRSHNGTSAGRRGMTTMLRRRVTAIERSRSRRSMRGGHTFEVTLDDRDVVTGDMVLLTGGERPDTDWLTDSGLDLRDGVMCDAALRVLAADGSGPIAGVVAAGSVACAPRASDGRPSRVGQWIAALEGGQAAAATLLSGAGSVAAAGMLPRWWSQQDELRIQACGDVDDGALTLTRLRPGSGDPARSGLLGSFHRDGRLVGIVAVNAPHAFTAQARALLRAAKAAAGQVVIETPELMPSFNI